MTLWGSALCLGELLGSVSVIGRECLPAVSSMLLVLISHGELSVHSGLLYFASEWGFCTWFE